MSSRTTYRNSLCSDHTSLYPTWNEPRGEQPYDNGVSMVDNGRNMVISSTSVANGVVKTLFSIILKRGKGTVVRYRRYRTETCQAKQELQLLEPSIASYPFVSGKASFLTSWLRLFPRGLNPWRGSGSRQVGTTCLGSFAGCLIKGIHNMSTSAHSNVVNVCMYVVNICMYEWECMLVTF